MKLNEDLMALSAAFGPTGHEYAAAELAAERLAPLVERVERDALGNLFGWRSAARPGAKTLLLDAHLDEVAMVVTGHEEGFLKFTEVGIDARILPGLRVQILAPTPCSGVITCLPPHVLTQEAKEKPFPLEQLRIDTGMTQEEAQANIPVGTPVVYSTRPFALGAHRLCGKSLDDRACFAMLLEVLRQLQGKALPVNLCILGSVQEEFSMAGIRTGAYQAQPDYALVTDVTFGKAPDTPSGEVFPLGCGPVIGVSPILNRPLSRALMACAQRLEIPFEKEIMPGSTGTNAMGAQISRMGVATMQVSVPLQYMHTPTEVIDLRDLAQSARLIAEFILSAGEGVMV